MRERAAELRTAVLDYCAEADVEPVNVVLDVAHVSVPCVLIGPPDLNFTEGAATWRIVALAGPGGAAWDQLGHLVAVLAEALPVTTATLGAFTVPDVGTFPSYTLTMEENIA